MGRVTYREDAAAMRRLLRDPGQPVYDMIDQLGADTADHARVVTGERLRWQTGDYAAGFSSRTDVVSAGPRATVTNSDGKALLLELGSSPHTIRPTSPGGYKRVPFVPGRLRSPPAGFLRFVIGGRVFFAREVSHPGTRPYGVLQEALRRGVDGIG